MQSAAVVAAGLCVVVPAGQACRSVCLAHRTVVPGQQYRRTLTNSTAMLQHMIAVHAAAAAEALSEPGWQQSQLQSKSTFIYRQV